VSSRVWQSEEVIKTSMTHFIRNQSHCRTNPQLRAVNGEDPLRQFSNTLFAVKLESMQKQL